MKLLYTEEKLLCTKTELLNFNFTISLAKLDIVGSNALIFSYDIPVNIQLVTFLLLCNIRELSIEAKTRIF